MPKDLQGALMKSKILDREDDFSVFDQECSITGHPGQHEITKIHRANVPKVGYEDRAFGLLHKILNALEGEATGYSAVQNNV